MNPAAFVGPAIGPVPIEFILFAFVLLGVALFHHHTLRVALTGCDRDRAVQDRVLAVSRPAPGLAGFARTCCTSG